MATKTRPSRAWGELGPLLSAKAEAAGPDRCMICRRLLARERHHNRRMCGRRSCFLEYRRLHDADARGDRGQRQVMKRERGETPGRVIEILECGHRLIQWATRAKGGRRRCLPCLEGKRKRLEIVDFTSPAT